MEKSFWFKQFMNATCRMWCIGSKDTKQSTVTVQKLWTLVACQTCLHKQCRPRSDWSGFPCLLPCQHFCEFKPTFYLSLSCLLLCQHFCEFKPWKLTFYLRTSYLPYRPRQTMQTQIRLILKKQSDQSLSHLLFWKHFCEFKPWKPTFYLRTSFLPNSPKTNRADPDQTVAERSLPRLLFWQHFCEFKPWKPTFYLRTSCLRYSPRQTEQIQISSFWTESSCLLFWHHFCEFQPWKPTF